MKEFEFGCNTFQVETADSNHVNVIYLDEDGDELQEETFEKENFIARFRAMADAVEKMEEKPRAFTVKPERDGAWCTFTFQRSNPGPLGNICSLIIKPGTGHWPFGFTSGMWKKTQAGVEKLMAGAGSWSEEGSESDKDGWTRIGSSGNYIYLRRYRDGIEVRGELGGIVSKKIFLHRYEWEQVKEF